jgi:hypothetical protein
MDRMERMDMQKTWDSLEDVVNANQHATRVALKNLM